MYQPIVPNNSKNPRFAFPRSQALATGSHTSLPAQYPARPSPSPYRRSDIGFNTAASVSALSLPVAPGDGRRRSQALYPEEGFDEIYRIPTSWSDESSESQQSASASRSGGAGRSWGPPDDDTANARAWQWKRWSESRGAADERPMSFRSPSPAFRADGDMYSEYSVSTTKQQNFFDRPPTDDGTSSISGASSTGLSRQSSSIASVRSFKMRDPQPLSDPNTKTQSLAERIASNERQNRLKEQLRRLDEEEQRAHLDAIAEDAQPVSRVDESTSVSRRVSAASSSVQNEHRRASNPVTEQSPTGNRSPVPLTASHRPSKDQISPVKQSPTTTQPLQNTGPSTRDQTSATMQPPAVNAISEAEESPDNGNLDQWNNEPPRPSRDSTSHTDIGEPRATIAPISQHCDLSELRNAEETISGPTTSPSTSLKDERYQPSFPNFYELHNQWDEPLELQHVELVKPSESMAVELHNQWDEPVELQHFESVKPSRLMAVELHNQWNEPIELQHVEVANPSKPVAVELHNQWNEPIELHNSGSAKARSPAIAELPPNTMLRTRELASNEPRFTNTYELESSVFDDVDSLINALPNRNKATTPFSTSRSTRSPSASISSVAGTRSSWHSQAPTEDHLNPHSFYAELPGNAPPPPPYSMREERAPPPPPFLPAPAPFTFELSASASVLRRPRDRGVHETHRALGRRGDMSVYNTLPHEAYPLFQDQNTFELPAIDYESDRRDLYHRSNADPGPTMVVQPDFHPRTGKPWGT